MGGSGGYAHGKRFLLVLLLSGSAVGSAWAAPPGKYPAADRVRAAVELLVGKVRQEAAPTPSEPLRTVERVVDGDTVVLDGKEKFRLIGINTPETVDPRRPVQKFGKEASARAKSLLEGKPVRVEYDAERKDRYGRTLGYLFLEDGTFVNLSLVEEGYATAYRYPPNVRYADRFREAERRAREGRRGLWAK
jgi:micrococcal nuclease